MKAHGDDSTLRFTSLRDAISATGPALRGRLATRHVELDAGPARDEPRARAVARIKKRPACEEAAVGANCPADQAPARLLLKTECFYGQRQLAKVEERILHLLARVGARARGSRRSIPPWTLHPSQQAAFDLADQLNEGLDSHDVDRCM